MKFSIPVVLAALAAFFVLAVAGQSAPASSQAIDCTIDNRQDWGPIYDEGDCAVGTTITVTNQLWFCAGPLSNLGPLPIRVVQTWDQPMPVGQNGIELRTGCSGDGSPADRKSVVEGKRVDLGGRR